MNESASIGDWTWAQVLNAGWVGLLVGTAIGIAGIVLSIVLYYRGKVAPKVSFVFSNQVIVGPAAPAFNDALEIRMSGKIVPRVTGTSFGLWNAGNTTIRGTDIVSSDRLRLELDTGEILGVSNQTSSRLVNGFDLEPVGDQKMNMHFDFLDPGDGFSFTLVHSAAPGVAALRGTIIGLPAGANNLGRSRNILASISYEIGLSAAATPLVIIALYGLREFGPVVSVLSVTAVFIAGVAVFAVKRLRDTKKPGRLRGVPSAVTDNRSLYAMLAYKV